MAVEDWKPVVGFEGLYEVSNLGRVRSLPRNGTRKKGTIRQFGNVANGYRAVLLARFGEHKNALVHRLVAEAFIPNPQNKPCVNHIDGDKWNNAVDNLEWCTYAENIAHSIRVLHQHKNSPLAVSVLCVETGVVYNSVAEAARKTGILRTAIHNCVGGFSATSGGYHWKKITQGEKIC
ncbi:NUMOD4 motif-containing HNH endonuclease [Candidatus Saccharibacteria bacterium]|nr:NUMOD4 motif-containing HNH endonuclease [Candidatus Saccharibacteria bacterium]